MSDITPSDGESTNAGDVSTTFPVVHDGSRWIELLFHAGIATGLASAAIVTAPLTSFAVIFLILALPFGGRTPFWIWRRTAERLELTSTVLNWHLGYAVLRLPLDEILQVIPVTGIRLTTRVSPDLQIRTGPEVRWKARRTSRWLWWLIWNTLPGSPAGTGAGGPMQIVQISPKSPENLLEALQSRCPHLTPSKAGLTRRRPPPGPVVWSQPIPRCTPLSHDEIPPNTPAAADHESHSLLCNHHPDCVLDAVLAKLLRRSHSGR